MPKLKITDCRNPHLWYKDEIGKSWRKKKSFDFKPAPDGNDIFGVVVPGKGFVYHGDYRQTSKSGK